MIELILSPISSPLAKIHASKNNNRQRVYNQCILICIPLPVSFNVPYQGIFRFFVSSSKLNSMASSGLNSPLRIAMDKGFSISCWITLSCRHQE
jgi:hypothetical protein